MIQSEVAPRLIGQDCFAVERCWELAYPVTFNILRDRRIGLVALAAADAAVWDAVGKALGEPLWRLWGGYRDTVELIVIGGYYDSEQSITDEITAYREMGLAGCKFKVGGDTPERDAARVHEARDGCRRRLRADGRRQPGLRRGTGDRPVPAAGGAWHPLVRGAVPVAQRPPRPARRAGDRRDPGVRRADAS